MHLCVCFIVGTFVGYKLNNTYMHATCSLSQVGSSHSDELANEIATLKNQLSQKVKGCQLHGRRRMVHVYLCLIDGEASFF